MSEEAPGPRPPQIAAAIINAMRAVVKVGKEGRNTDQNFKYRKYDDILTAAHGALVDAGLVIIPTVVDMKQRTRDVTTKSQNLRTVTTTIVTVDYQLMCADDGSEKTIRYYGEASDYGDKSLGKALSYAEKMMLISVLKIPVESDDMDPDQHSHADDAPATRTSRPSTVREPRPRSAAARRGADQPKKNQTPAAPPPPEESDDALHADIIERLAVFNEDPLEAGGTAELTRIWGDVQRGRQANLWAREDYNALHAHVQEIAARIQKAEAAAAAQLKTSRPKPTDADPWADDPGVQAAAAEAAQADTNPAEAHPFAGLPGRDKKGERDAPVPE